MRRLLLLMVCAAASEAQVISITSPTSNQVVSGFSGVPFVVSLASAPSVTRVCYTVDGYPATNPGTNGLNTAGCALAPYTFSFNTFWVMNGPHQVTATAYDALGNVVATNTQPFVVANTWPVSCGGSPPALSVSTGTPVTSTWSGGVTVTAQITGACATDNLKYFFWLDGTDVVSVGNVTDGQPRSTTFDTTRFFDGQHVVAVTVQDSTNNTVYQNSIDGTENGAAEWSRTVTFSNGAVPSDVWNNFHDFYLTPGATATLGCNVVNANGTAGTPVPCDYTSLNTAVATVGGSGNVTVANPLPAQGTSAQILTMGETVSCTDLSTALSSLFTVTSTCHVFHASDTGRLMRIISGTNWIPGLYQISAVNESINAATMSLPGSGAPQNVTTSTAASGGHFGMGPTRTAWILGEASNILPHFGRNNTILTSYDPVNSTFVHCGFSSSVLVTDQIYNPSFGSDLSASGFNCLEQGVFNGTLDTFTSGQQSAFQSAANSYISTWLSQLASLNFTKQIFTWGTGENLAGSGPSIWGSTSGPAASWSPTGVQYIFEQWVPNMLAISVVDEVNSPWGGHPLAGPITFTGGANGSISSIVASSGTCTISGINGFGVIGGFVIHGSVIPNMNNVAPTISHLTGSTFPCAGVANGTYSSSNDPGLVLEPFANTWFASNTSYVLSSAFASFRTQGVAAGGGRAFMGWPNAANTNCSSLGNWNGNSVQSNSGVSNISDYNDMYPNHGNEQYLSSRVQLSSVINDPLGFGSTMRNAFGCYNPSHPTVMLTQGTSTGFGFQGYPVAISTISNGLVTFSAPHGLINIIPGLTRLTVTGASNPAFNTNFYVTDAPTPTTADIVLAATDFTDTADTPGTGGTLTFADGTELATSSQKATGGITITPLGSTHVTYSGTPTNNVNRHRCQTFTLSGTSTNSAWNTRTFSYGCENLSVATDGNGSASAVMYIRELPSGTSTGGTASIIADNTMVKGRNGDTQLLDYNPEFTFGTVMECAVTRCAGQRLYKVTDEFQEYMDHAAGNGVKAGWGAQALGAVTLFGDTTVANQLQANPHFENARAVPTFRAASTGAQMMNRWQKYILQPTLQSPDYGFLISCGARASSYGNILMCWNASDAPQSRTFNLAPYLQTGQNIIRSRATYQGISPLGIISAGTQSDSITLASGEAVFYVFPASFALELPQPILGVRLADVANATKVVVRYSYDNYLLDSTAANVQDCGSGTACVLNADRSFGIVYYRMFFLGANGAVLATSDVQTQ
ncbi:MAG: hypothetical protein ABSE86_06720 [Bryobacteraceae bacterium]